MLKRELTIALYKASRTKETVGCNVVEVEIDGVFIQLNMVIHCIENELTSLCDRWLYLIVFEEVGSELGSDIKLIPETYEETPENLVVDSLDIEVLKRQLITKEEYLRATNEELETTNEELKSSNEEMQSINEELQSANEELETSKEELQSVNEELSTVNMELQTKVSELAQTNNDMNNLLAGTGIATIFVDHELSIFEVHS